jgi:4-aminobutyrate aminotransferase-like enzyme
MAAPGLAREIERYVARTPKSRALQREAESVLPGGSSRGTAYFAPYPFFAEKGEGHHVHDVDRNRSLEAATRVSISASVVMTPSEPAQAVWSRMPSLSP